MEGFFYFCGRLKTIRLSWYAYLQPDMETATLLGDKKLENEAISLLKSCLINHQLPLLVVLSEKVCKFFGQYRKELLWSPLVGFCKCAATDNVVKSQVGELHGLGFHANLQFTQRIKVFEHTKKHNDEVFPTC